MRGRVKPLASAIEIVLKGVRTTVMQSENGGRG